eukprot:CAMPEP_0185773610 /NCGR_PEP_ID=MMETSP1174-20130828/74362_1 /TAXON_ID=35687 /ORGANISM="Dictyocha speculum, Strain CCMP1381" /LENGTH=99 /DNA_ID=CAMNT_0028460379 /DNA_START=151 /DNA_END=447 /DNA_ORIENTATION=+
MGVNMVAANRVILYDTSWNPASDLQALFRCYRLGQTKPVFVYRLVMAKSLEETVYKRQVTKAGLAHRVVDKVSTRRHFKANEIDNLYDKDNNDEARRVE